MRRKFSSRLQERQRKLLIGKIVVGVIAVAALVAAISYYSGVPSMTVHEITVDGNRAVSTDEIVTQVNEDMAGRYLYLFSRRNVLFYPKSAICEKILSSFLWIKDVALSEKDHVLGVTVTERKPEALWCNPAGSSCYFLDENGLIFAAAPDFSGSVYVKFIGTISDDPLGQYFMSPGDFRNARQFLKDMSDLGATARSYTIGTEGEIRLLTEERGEIIWNKEQSLADVLQKYRAARTEIESTLKVSKTPLSYVDLRFASQVIYKFK